MAGMGFAGRQVWLQHFPTLDQNECGVSLTYMAKVLPFNQLLDKILQGTAECTKVGFEFLHFNMAEWALIWFIVFFFFSIYLFLREMA